MSTVGLHNINLINCDQLVAERQRKLAEKEVEKQRKLDEKEAEKQRKLAEKQRKLDEKEAEKQRKLAEKQRKLDEKQRKLAEKESEKQRKLTEKYEVKNRSLLNISRIGKEASEKYENNQFTAKELANMYITKYGRINPYTLEPVDDNYDIYAAIRGIMEETSPSSAQHWFRFGKQKTSLQVAPWIFVNKELASVNHSFGWKITTKEMASARRKNKGKWSFLPDGSNSIYDWSNEKYGPLPTNEMLAEAAVGRKSRHEKNEK
jgi:hypothetical protein